VAALLGGTAEVMDRIRKTLKRVLGLCRIRAQAAGPDMKLCLLANVVSFTSGVLHALHARRGDSSSKEKTDVGAIVAQCCAGGSGGSPEKPLPPV
jgi:hypothetical protein